MEAIRKGGSFSLLPSGQEMLRNAPREIGRDHELVSDARPMRAHGYVNQNIGRKHDERVFFTPERTPLAGTMPWSAPVNVSLSADEWSRLAKDWKLLIRNYTPFTS